MLQLILATIGFVVVACKSYQHYREYQKLKAQNDCLRRRWKEQVRTGQQTSCR